MGVRGKEWGGVLSFPLASGGGALGLEWGLLDQQAACLAWPSLFLLPCPSRQPPHSISLLSTDGTQVSPGAHCPSPPGTGKSGPEGECGGEWKMRWKGQKRGEELRGGSERWLADWPESWEVGVLGEGRSWGFVGKG